MAEALMSLREEADLLPDRHAALLDLFKGVGNAFDMEAYQLHLREELIRKRFYDRLSAFARTLQTAFSCQQWIEDTSERVIANYKSDLKKFEELRRAVRLRYGDAEEDYDYRRYQAAVRALLDKHIDTTDLIPVVPPVDIFDEDSFRAVVKDQTGTPASIADTILSAAARTITERMEDDPALYTRFSKMVQEIIDAFRAGRLSEAEYLTRARDARAVVVRETTGRGGEDVPESVRGTPLTSALYRQAAESMREISGAATQDIAVLIATEFANIIARHARVGWVHDGDIEKLMRQDMDDFLIDEIKGRGGQYGLNFDLIDTMLDQAIARARKLSSQ